MVNGPTCVPGSLYPTVLWLYSGMGSIKMPINCTHARAMYSSEDTTSLSKVLEDQLFGLFLRSLSPSMITQGCMRRRADEETRRRRDEETTSSSRAADEQQTRKKPYIGVYCRILHAYTIMYANIHQRVLFYPSASLSTAHVRNR